MNKYLLIIFSITLMAVMGLAGVSPVLPKIADHFEIAPGLAGLVMAAFALPGVIFTPIFGYLADKYGRKLILVPALLLFGISGFLCSIAPNFEILLVFRFLQGIGAASLGALNIVLISDLFQIEKRTKYIGINHAVLSFGTALFPIVAGKLANISWHLPFYIPVLAVPVALLVLFVLPETQKGEGFYKKVKFGGVITNRKFIFLFIISISTFMLLMGPFLTYVPFIVEKKMGLEPLKSGLVLATMSLTNVIFAPLLGRFVTKFNHKLLLVVGFLGYAIALFLFQSSESYPYLFLASFIFGFSHSINLPNVQSIFVKLASDESKATVLSVNRMVSQIGQFLGPFLLGVSYEIGTEINSNIEYVFLLSASFAVAISFLIILFFRNNLVGKTNA